MKKARNPEIMVMLTTYISSLNTFFKASDEAKPTISPRRIPPIIRLMSKCTMKNMLIGSPL